MKKHCLLLSLALTIAIPAFSYPPSLTVKPETNQVVQIRPDTHKLRWHERVLLGMAERKVRRKIEKMNWQTPSNGCDTMVMSDGSLTLIKLINKDDSFVYFVLCNYEKGKVQTVPWTIVRHIRRSNGEMVDRYTPMTEPAQDDSALLNEAKAVRVLGILSIPLIFLFGLGIVLGIITLVKGKRLLKKAKGKPDEKKIREIAGIGITMAVIAVTLGLGLLILALVFAN